MKYRALFLVCMTFILFSGCQTGSSRNLSASRESSPSPSRAMKAIDADDDWLTLFHCQGNDYLLETKITTTPGSIRLVLSGQGQTMAMPVSGGRSGAVMPVPQDLGGPLDNEAGSFAIADQAGARGTQLVGVFESPDRFAAVFHGRTWNGASMMIGVRKRHRNELEALLARADSQLGQIASRSPLGTIATVFKRKSQGTECSKDETAWAERIQQAIEQTQGHGGNSDPGKLATAMFSDDNFRSIFGDSLYDIGLDDPSGKQVFHNWALL